MGCPVSHPVIFDISVAEEEDFTLIIAGTGCGLSRGRLKRFSDASHIPASRCGNPARIANERKNIVKIVITIIAIIFVILAVFTVANWQVLTTSTPLSFVVFSMEGPLGVILLGVMIILTILVVAYALLLRTTWLMESRRLNRQLEEQRELANEAESSRLIALQKMIEGEFEKLHTEFHKVAESGLTRIEEAEKSLAGTIEDTSNSILAHVGYLDDKMKGGQ